MNDTYDVTTQPQHQPAPFNRMIADQGGINVGAIAIEQERAVAEAQGKLTLAKKFPRSMTGAMNEFLESCKSPDFAARAFYSVPNRGSGPSIRFAEEAARCYGNFEYGHRELSRSEGKSEVEVFAWDMQNNNYSKRQITVAHIRDTKNGGIPLRDQADIDNRIANVASKQMRGRILALLPKHLVAAGEAACRRTLAGGDGEKPMADRVVRMIQLFGKYGITQAHIERKLKHSADLITVDELADLQGDFNAIKEGGKPSEYFPLEDDAAAEVNATGAAILQQAKQNAAAATPAPAPAAKATRTRQTASPAPAPADEKVKAEESEVKPTKDDAQAVSQEAAPAPEPDSPKGDDDEPF